MNAVLPYSGLTQSRPPIRPAALPGGITASLVPMLTCIGIRVNDLTTLHVGDDITAWVDYRRSDSRWMRGPYLKPMYGADRYYGKTFNNRENTAYEVRITVEYKDPGTGKRTAIYNRVLSGTTRNSVVPIDLGDRMVVYVDAVNGNNSWNGQSPVFTSGSTGPKLNLDGSGTSVVDLIQADNDRGWDIYIVNGVWPNLTTSTRRLTGIRGAADNWIRILPYDGSSRISGEAAVDGTWISEGSGVYSMLLGATQWNASNTMANIYDLTIGHHLYPFKTKSDFDAATIGDGTGYFIVNVNPTSPAAGHNPNYADGAPILYVRLVSGANPGTNRLKGAFGSGLLIQNCRYILIDELPFQSCGLRAVSNGSLGSAGLVISATTANTEDIIVRDCPFSRNATDISIQDDSAFLCRYVLLEGNTWLFEGPWEHFFEQFDYTEADPYVQTSSWSHVKSSVWEKSALFLYGHEGIETRNNVCTGQQLMQHTAGVDTTNMEHFHSQGDRIEKCWDDALGDVEGTAFVNASFVDIAVDKTAVFLSFTPCSSGPFWIVSGICNDYFHYPFKIGSQTSTAAGHGYKIISGVSCRAMGFSDDGQDGMMRTHNGHSGLEITNLVASGVQSGDSSADVFYMQNGGVSSGNIYTVLSTRINSWKNVHLFMKSKADPNAIAPSAVRWRSPAGTMTTYATFADANAALAATDTVWIDIIANYSDNGAVDPFPTSVEDGLDTLITTRSIYVRGISELAGPTPVMRDLPIGWFPLRAAE